MKFVLKIILTFLISVTISSDIVIAAETITTPTNVSNLKVGDENSTGVNGTVKENTHLEKLQNNETDFSISKGGQKGISDSLRRIARDLKNLFFMIAGVYLVFITVKLLFAEKTDEEVTNFKKGIIWISIGILITQISYYFVNILYDKDIGTNLAYDASRTIIEPIIALMETGASFVFLAMAIYAFFKIVTANGDEEAVKSGKMTIFYALIGFIVIKITNALVTAVYWKTHCGLFQTCSQNVNLSGALEIIVKIINWMNGFIGLVVVIMIIYAGFLTITSAGNEDNLKKAKSIIIYIAVGLLVLVMNYFILTFFIIPEGTI